MTPERWEVGSDFHALDLPWDGRRAVPWADDPHALYGAGRDPVIGIVKGGAARRLWVPSYFCQEVLRSWQGAGIELVVYRDGPTDPPAKQLSLTPGDAVLSVSYFGVRAPPRIEGRMEGVTVIEDHTHDPFSDWARTSRADYCVASLRKTLPIPDGAVVWSPRGRDVASPPSMSDRRARAVVDRLTAMILKARYLRGERIDKEEFRRCAVRGEEGLGVTEPSAASEYTSALLGAFAFDAWRRARADNHEALADAIGSHRSMSVLGVRTAGAVPFSVVLCFTEPHVREVVRKQLIARRVYPAILWSLREPAVDGVPAEHVALSARVLSLHCDGRYDAQTMRRVAAMVLESVEASA